MVEYTRLRTERGKLTSVMKPWREGRRFGDIGFDLYDVSRSGSLDSQRATLLIATGLRESTWANGK